MDPSRLSGQPGLPGDYLEKSDGSPLAGLPSGNLQAVSSDDFEPEVYTPKESILRYGGGGASRYVQDNIRTRMEFGTQTLRNKELNDPSWGFNPYDAPSSGDYIKGVSRGLVL